MSQQTVDKAGNLPDPAEMAKTYAEVAQRASRLLTQFMEKKAKEGVEAPTDEMGVAKAFMDISARLLASPYRMAQTQMAMMRDHIAASVEIDVEDFGYTPFVEQGGLCLLYTSPSPRD